VLIEAKEVSLCVNVAYERVRIVGYTILGGS
jgi:hypothetical protein